MNSKPYYGGYNQPVGYPDNYGTYGNSGGTYNNGYNQGGNKVLYPADNRYNIYGQGGGYNYGKPNQNDGCM